MLKEFKEFAFGGNLIDIATGLIMGLAFAALVAALVENLIMPLVGIAGGAENIADMWTVEIGNAVLRIGAFVSALLTFIATAAGVFFFIVKPYQRYKATQPPEAEEAPPEDIVLLRKIADNLAR